MELTSEYLEYLTTYVFYELQLARIHVIQTRAGGMRQEVNVRRTNLGECVLYVTTFLFVCFLCP